MMNGNIGIIDQVKCYDPRLGECIEWACPEYTDLLRNAPSNGLKIKKIISITRKDHTYPRDWRDFQAIKNALVGQDWEAVELYPAEVRVNDPSNMYYLWCARKFDFGFTEEQAKKHDFLPYEKYDGKIVNLQRPRE